MNVHINPVNTVDDMTFKIVLGRDTSVSYILEIFIFVYTVEDMTTQDINVYSYK